MIVDQNLLLGQFAKKRNMPVKYDRNLVEMTMKAMERIEEIRAKRERVFTRRRLSGKAQRDAKRRQDLKVVAEGEHLIRKELQDLEMARQEGQTEAQLQEQEVHECTGRGEATTQVQEEDARRWWHCGGDGHRLKTGMMRYVTTTIKIPCVQAAVESDSDLPDTE